MRRLLLLAVMVAGMVAGMVVVMEDPAGAEDQRPCVSKAEFFGARDFGIPLVPGHDRLTKVEPLNLDPIGRAALEGWWDVRHDGVAVTGTVDGERLGLNDKVRVKMYRACERALADVQVYVGFHKDTDLVLWTIWWSVQSPEQVGAAVRYLVNFGAVPVKAGRASGAVGHPSRDFAAS